jgi:phosphopantothenoylcysteine decarboxylase/phosphopantothenate--cysteine ligase
VETVKGREIIIGVTGGIAAYKAAEIVRLLVKRGANVSVIMTGNAQKFIQPQTFQTLSRNRVATDMFPRRFEVEENHIAWAVKADLVLVAPATANIIGKYASGIADDFLSTFLLATRAPVVIAPAMNHNMYLHPVVQANMEKLKGLGVHFIEPGTGELAMEGEYGIGRLADPQAIVERAEEILARSGDMTGKNVLVTAGPTQEPIDAVRHISNRSSGKMGFAVARAAADRGASVTLVSGPTTLKPPGGVTFLPVTTALEMRERVLEHLESTHILVKSAAVLDFRPRVQRREKVKKEEADLILELERNPDILAEVGTRKGDRVLVGFAAETDNLLDYGKRKLKEKNLDLIIVNDISCSDIGFGSDDNTVVIMDREGGVEELPKMSKDRLADHILDRVLNLPPSQG